VRPTVPVPTLQFLLAAALPGLRALMAAACVQASGGVQAPATPGPPPVQPNAVERVTAAASYPDDPRLDVALEMLRKGSYEAAASTARAVLSSNDGIDRARAILGIALNKSKRYDDARAMLEKAASSTQPYPERRHAPHFLGWCCYHLGDLAAARAAFEEHLRRVPGEPDSTFGLALIALDEDRLDDADKFFAAALKGFSEPKPRGVDQARVLTRMADLALRRDEVSKAEELLDRAVKASALQHETWSKIARVKDRLGKTAEADAARANAKRILDALGRSAPEPPGTAPAPAPAPTQAKDGTK